MNTIQNGIWSGILATGPMTLAMFRMQESLPADEKSPLPPATLTSQITGLIGLDQKISSQHRPDLTMISHFAYGASAGILYSWLAKKTKTNSLITGGAFGFGVWAASYFGWIPVFGLRASGLNMPPKRNALMLIAHLVWGASLSLAEKELRRHGQQMLDGHRKASHAE